VCVQLSVNLPQLQTPSGQHMHPAALSTVTASQALYAPVVCVSEPQRYYVSDESDVHKKQNGCFKDDAKHSSCNDVCVVHGHGAPTIARGRGHVGNRSGVAAASASSAASVAASTEMRASAS
jgi:hypothetical protein